MTISEALEKAIAVVGTQEKFARRLGVTSPSVAEWKERGIVPPKRVLDIERITGVSRHELRPDLYPRERAARRSA